MCNDWADLALGNNIGNTLTKLRIPAHLSNFTRKWPNGGQKEDNLSKRRIWRTIWPKGGRPPDRRTLVHYGRNTCGNALSAPCGNALSEPAPFPSFIFVI